MNNKNLASLFCKSNGELLDVLEGNSIQIVADELKDSLYNLIVSTDGVVRDGRGVCLMYRFNTI